MEREHCFWSTIAGGDLAGGNQERGIESIMATFDKGEGYADSSVIGCQFSVYPLRQVDVDTPVQASIRARRRDASASRNLGRCCRERGPGVCGAGADPRRAAPGSGRLVATLAAGNHR
jgi:hypothetical protein